ncbi:hypothetical protein THASP1DRAFT_27103 [Thamnocephalis sphaerospora]|uniref:Uncharacterized protein n=1 Tax=Thamnocephalis sphaerospora TaxID=78915 RepID=A0A4P9XXS0_9FUNG|nr:hypothetical protein THASP1DRAFT_27103 [Thamnocephalis sphaerospora]|eukprot:RKP11124.1 hypothetical protein THASP1DRAFT_27103 [Thamnocephalis sphaerospora]
MMVWIKGRVGQIDLDDLLAYDTFKVVHVRDRRLGGLYWFFNIAIFAYVIYSIVIDQKYNIKEAPVPGSVRISLKEPANGIGTPGYCAQTQGCVYLAADQILFPQGSDRELFITTRISRTTYTPRPGCDAEMPTNPDCVYTEGTRNASRNMYVADIENYTLMIEHSIRGKVTSISMRSGLLKGALVAQGAKAKDPASIRRYENATMSKDVPASAARPENVDGDVMRVGELLDAVSLNLDTPSFAPGANRANGESQRSAGAVIVVIIDYLNRMSRSDELKYYYRPSIIDGAEYKIMETRRNPDGTITEFNRHGVKITFQQSGIIGRFDFLTLLINLVSAIALLKMASLIVEVLMLRFLPERQEYQRSKFEHTEDFGDLRKMRKRASSNANSEEETKEADKEAGLVRGRNASAPEFLTVSIAPPPENVAVGSYRQ